MLILALFAQNNSPREVSSETLTFGNYLLCPASQLSQHGQGTVDPGLGPRSGAQGPLVPRAHVFSGGIA